MTQAEFEAVGLHVCNSQTTGDLIYASSSSQLSRLAIGNGVLYGTGGTPTWATEIDNITLDTAVAKGTWTASGTWTLPAHTLGGIVTLPSNQVFQGGTLMIAGAASPPNPDTTVHIWSGSAGTVTPLSGTILTIEDNTAMYVTLLTPASTENGIFFGSPTSAIRAGVIYVHSSDTFKFRSIDVDKILWTAGSWAFQEATTLNLGTTGQLQVAGTKVVGARVVDARADDTIAGAGAYDDTTAGVIDALRDAMITHGLIAAT